MPNKSQSALLPDTYYHIYQRGNNRQSIFFEPENYRYFLSLYVKYIVPVALTFAYCLLPNHLHFLIKTRGAGELGQQKQKTYDFSEKSYVSQPHVLQPSEQFRRLFIAYSKAINKRYQRTGSLFENRFGRKRVTSQRYLVTLIRYIHQNPQNHGLVPDFREWPYSSYDAVLTDKPTRVDQTAVLNWFGGTMAFVNSHETAVNEAIIEHLITF